ncbi:hypothetical protein A6B43_01305 [Vespertiliibacter pulmonis]|uniref:Lipoprotein n=1 Tax=Vespertiliibacter pulmonis TaxID=1443036 RepID=A0A3N4VY34_9PAST|nr:hypothetical protein [Vespertiliibacter pulmonis]QLB20272.1 hypothetical protein A6B43_01305 [Vespertiliibacter pulmonis]RPE86253.1 hypothetical protein EDC46_0647 [Vespertiliibacter pulmonis]
MKLKYALSTILTTIFLTGCVAPSGNYAFDASLLSPQIYNKYWAMKPQDDVANVLKITADGNATLYRYSCDHLNNYKTKNKGTFGQLIEKIAKDAEEKQPGTEDLVRALIKVERYKLETTGKNKVDLNAIFIGRWSNIEFTSVSNNYLKATQTFFSGLVGGTKYIEYTNVQSPSFPVCKK